MAVANSATSPDEDSGDLNTLLAPTIADPKQQGASQLSQQPGRVWERLPGNGTGLFYYGPKARKGNFRRFIDAKNSVKKPVEKPEEEGEGYYNQDDWGDYYRDEKGQWWYLDRTGQLYAEQGSVWIVADKCGYSVEGDGRKWYRDIEGKWWAEHRVKVPVKMSKAESASDIKEKTLESKGKISTEQGAIVNAQADSEKKKKKKKKKKSKESCETVYKKLELGREDFSKSMTFVEYNKVLEENKEKMKASEAMKFTREVNKEQFDGMQIAGKKNKQGEPEFTMKKADEKKGNAALKVQSINELLKFDYKGSRGSAHGRTFSSNTGPEGRYQGRFSDYNGARRSSNANTVPTTGRQGPNDNGIRFCYPEGNDGSYNRDRRFANADEERKKPVTPVVKRVLPPPSVQDLHQFPALSRVSKA